MSHLARVRGGARRAVSVTLLTVLVGALASPAAADTHWRGGIGGPPSSGDPSPGPAPSGHLWWDIRRGEDEAGESCWEMYARREDEPPPEGNTWQAVRDRLDVWDVSGVAFEACPQVVSPAAIALQLWVELAPQGVTGIDIPPGYALAGLRTYLVFDGPPPLRATNSDFGVTIAIEAEPEFIVDWGDGSAPLRTTSQGVPYPGGPGEITHVYTDVGAPTVTVTTEWTARFLVDGVVRADLPGRTLVDTYDHEVRERRAVRTR